MNASQTIYSICVPRIEENGFYRIKTVWNNYDFIMVVLDGENAFHANVTQEQLENFAKQYEMSSSDYIAKIHSSLCGDSDEKYLYKRREDEFLILRQENNITVRLANFILKTVNFLDTVENFIDEITKIAVCYKMKFNICEEEKEVILSEKNEYTQKLEEYVRLKEEMEQDLYSKFILILNEKKQRIQYLQEMIEFYKSGNEDAENEMSDIEQDVKSEVVNTKKPEVISESDSDTNGVDYFQMETQVQIEHHEPEFKNKCLSEMEEIPSIGALPKRVKEINSNIIVINQTNVVESVTDNSKMHDEISVAPSQESFNTQDLLDRL